MYCQNCGNKLDDNAKFCPNCGTKVLSNNQESKDDSFTSKLGSTVDQIVESTSNEVQGAFEDVSDDVKKVVNDVKEDVREKMNNSQQSVSDFKEKMKHVDIYTLLEKNNVDKLVSLIPFVLLGIFVVRRINSLLFRNIFSSIIIYDLFKIIDNVTNILLYVVMITSIAGLTAIVYRHIAYSEKEMIHDLEGLTCILSLFVAIFFKYGKLNIYFVFAIIAAICVLAFDFFVKSFILDEPVSGNLNLKNDVELAKAKFASIKAHRAQEKAMEKKLEEQRKTEKSNYVPEFEDRGESYFDGSGGELLGKLIVAALISMITCGVAAPFYIVKIFEWRYSHTVINGNRMKFNGTGSQLWGLWIKWWFLTIITCGIYGLFAYVDFCKWEAKHASFEYDTSIDGIFEHSYFDGNTFEYLGYSLLIGLIISITCGIAYPWMMIKITEWKYKNTVVCGHRLNLKADGSKYFGTWFVNGLLTGITCGIYSSWAICKENAFITKNTKCM